MGYNDDILFMFFKAAAFGAFIPVFIGIVLQSEKYLEIVVFLFVLAFVGASAGITGGLSRVGAVGDIIPAFFGLLGGLVLYLFGADKTKGLIVPLGVLSLTLSLVLAYLESAALRSAGEDARQLRSICANAYTNPDLLGNYSAFSRFKAEFAKKCEGRMVWWLVTPD